MNPIRAVADMIKQRALAHETREQDVKRLETESQKTIQKARVAARLASYGRIEFHRHDRR